VKTGDGGGGGYGCFLNVLFEDITVKIFTVFYIAEFLDTNVKF